MADMARLLGMMGGGAPGGGPPPGAPMPGMGPNVLAGPGAQRVGAVGPATSSQPKPGNMHAALGMIRNAVTLLEQAIPLIPMGVPLHTDLMKTTEQLLKHMSEAASNPAGDLQSLMNILRQRAQNAPNAAAQRMLAPPGAGGGGGPPPGGAPAGGGPEPPAMPMAA